MPLIEGDYLTISETATLLGVSQGAVRVAITRGTLRAEPIEGLPHVKLIARPEAERYMRERADRGWDKRRTGETDQEPSQAAQRSRAYRQRKKTTAQPVDDHREPLLGGADP